MKIRYPLLCGTALMAAMLTSNLIAEDEQQGPFMIFENPSGYAATFNTAGQIDESNPFFQSLGTNGRSCSTCHQASDGWTVVPSHIQQRFVATGGTDPIFRLVDGANSPNADVSSVEARIAAYSMLLTRGLIRVGMAIPDNAEFELIGVDDPYGYASAKELSLFRRPLPTTNLKFLSTLMWDGRETLKDPASKDCIFGTTNCFSTMHFDLADQSNTATLTHAQGIALTAEERDAIVQFESGLFTAQIQDMKAWYLGAQNARGGPYDLVAQASYFGINDVVSGDYQTAAAFNPVVFSVYDAWTGLTADPGSDPRIAEARQAVARGQLLFNTKAIQIKDVKGINDDLSVAVLPGTCTTCHDNPNAGNHSIPAPLDIGVADASRRTPDMPLYQLRNKTTGEVVATTDPGRALITGKWKDIGRFKGPTLRAVATRAPYFHNGSAADLDAVVDFYNTRFQIVLTQQEHDDLVAFLRTL